MILFDGSPSGVTTISVSFDGTLSPTDPISHFRNQEGESWAILMNRAIAQHLNINLTTANGGNAGPVMFALTGRTVTGSFATGVTNNSTFFANPLTDFDRDALINNYRSGKAIVAATRDSASQMAGNFFAVGHVYAVVAVYAWIPFGQPILLSCNVLLYNPWGTDVKAEDLAAGTATPWGANDGFISVPWELFRLNFDELRYA